MHTDLVFLCGFPSSGTDLLKNVMNAHPDIWMSGEFPFLPRLAREYGAPVPGWQARGCRVALRLFDYPITRATGYRPLTRIGKCAGYLWDRVARCG